MAKRTPRSEARDTGVATPPRPEQIETDAPAQMGPTEEEIRLRAYHRYLERGGGHGMDFEDWLEAERELKNRG